MRKENWSGREDLNLRSRASEARALARLSYTLIGAVAPDQRARTQLAARRGFDPLSSVRQTDCHASSIASHHAEEIWCAWADSNGH